MNWKTILALITAFMTGAITNYVLAQNKIKQTLKKIIGDLIDDVVDQVYPCKLIATIKYNQEQESTIVDMSQYNSLGTIGIIINKIDPPSTEDEEALDDEPIIYQTAVVYNVGGHWLWKVL